MEGGNHPDAGTWMPNIYAYLHIAVKQRLKVKARIHKLDYIAVLSLSRVG